MKYKSAKGWCIISPKDSVIGHLWHERQKDCISHLISIKKKEGLILTWSNLEALGYRCVKARVSAS